MKERFLFVRPPRPLWPFNGPSTGFWPPLAFASLAAALREGVGDLDVRILDAPAQQMGWRTLEQEVHALTPTYVGLGEEAVSAAEGLRLAAVAKACGARVVAGGCFFGHVAPEALRTGLVDVVVHGEGEETVTELVEALRSGGRRDLERVRGISFREDEEIISTPPRPLIPDLDRLPFPAYDLLPVECYGARSRNHPALAAVELGRGCGNACSFCVLWRQMGRPGNGNASRQPHLRTKSPERALDEIRVLTRRFGRRYLAWVDPCFNADPRAAGRLAELMLRDGIRVGQSAWVRADGIVRDEASGALEECVRAGLNEVYLGVERPDRAGLQALGKETRPGVVENALEILSKQYPEVFTVGSFIYGLPGDHPRTMRAIHRYSIELDLDMVFYIPLTPLPGTPYWRPEFWDSTGETFRSFDFLPGNGANGHQARLTRTLLTSIALDWRPLRVRWYLRRVLTRNPRKRRIQRNLFFRGLRFLASRTTRTVFGRNGTGSMVLPTWYDR